MFILTREVNEYDQSGEYFVVAYKHRPTYEMLSTDTGIDSKAIKNLLLYGGGRIGSEYEWWNLHQLNCGETIPKGV
jgi:hypothetical protein